MYAIFTAFSRAKKSVAYKYIGAVSICAFSRLRKRALKKKSLETNFFAGFHDKTRLKSANKKMELAIPMDRVDVYLSLSERIIHLPHVYPKLCLIEFGK